MLYYKIDVRNTRQRFPLRLAKITARCESCGRLFFIAPTTHYQQNCYLPHPTQQIFALRAKRAATTPPSSAIAALFPNSRTAPSHKNFPQPGFVLRPPGAPRFVHVAWKVQKYCIQPPAEESSGRMRKVWREREDPTKGSSLLPPRSFPHSTSTV